jgi:hypothetical protein
MDLNELKKQIEAETEKTVALKKEKKELENNIKRTIYKNLKEIVTPVISEMNSFLQMIRDKSGVCFRYDDERFPLALGLNVPDYYSFEIKINSYGLYLNFGKHTSYGWTRDVATPDYEYTKRDVFDYGHHLYLSEWFYSEEKAMELVDICREKYVKILDYYASALRNENDSLATAIELLKDTYAKSHCVEHNEDGTVEIHLGGKTYKPTLNED